MALFGLEFGPEQKPNGTLIITGIRIQNQYLLSILSLVTRLGAQNVSSAILVEAWKEHGRQCDDVFFMHFDVLHNYQFLKKSEAGEKPLALEQLMDFKVEQDNLVSITHEGQEFLHRFG